MADMVRCGRAKCSDPGGSSEPCARGLSQVAPAQMRMSSSSSAPARIGPRRSVSVLEYEELGMEAVWKIEVEDFPAFIVNRILMPMINEAVYTLYEGVGNVKSIDSAMKLGTNHPMGPLELADFIGLDTCLAIMNVLHDGLADTKYRPCPLLTKYVEAGWLGRKTGRGFYDYRGETPVPTR